MASVLATVSVLATSSAIVSNYHRSQGIFYFESDQHA